MCIIPFSSKHFFLQFSLMKFQSNTFSSFVCIKLFVSVFIVCVFWNMVSVYIGIFFSQQNAGS